MSEASSVRVGSPGGHGLTRFALLLVAAASLVSPAHAGGLRLEYGLGLNGLMPMGGLASARKFGYGGDFTLNAVREGGGLGLRAAGSLVYFQSAKTGTGQMIFNGTGTQESKFGSHLNLKWLAVGPEWSSPVGDGRMDYFVMVGAASVDATSSGTYFNVAGPDPGTTGTSLVLAGAMWTVPDGSMEIGAELFTSGRASLWDDPPIMSDGGSGFVTRERQASITSAVIRLAWHFGSM